MVDESPVHIYSKAVHKANTTYYTGYMVFDDTGNIRRVSRKVYAHEDDLTSAHRRALRDALTDVFATCSPANAVVHEPDLAHPALELGRVHPDVRERLVNANISITRQQQNNAQKLLYALVRQDTATAWYTTTSNSTVPTGPLHVYIDGSHRNETHSEFSGASTTVGYVIIDGAGRIVTMEAHPLDEPSESLHAEYIALKQAIDKVKQLPPVDEVIFKTDNNNLKYTFTDGNEAPARFHLIAAYIREALDSLNNGRVIETNRTKNLFADSLADLAHDQAIQYQPIDVTVDPESAGYTYTV